MTLARRETNALDIVRHAEQLLTLGSMLVKSGFLPSSVRTPEQAVVIILKGQELGLPPMAALNGITVIQGKPTVSPQLMLSLINASGLLEDQQITTGEQGASVTLKRRGRSAHTEAFGPKEAKDMGLATKDNYKKQPAVMYKWRAIAACARVVFPDVIDGLYTPEEMGADVRVDDEGGMEVVEAEVQQLPPAEEKPQVDQKLRRALFARLNDLGFDYDERRRYTLGFLAFVQLGDVSGVRESVSEYTDAQLRVFLDALKGGQGEGLRDQYAARVEELRAAKAQNAA